MNKATLSLLTVISTASLIITFFLAQHTAKHDFHHESDALSFQAPHLQRNDTSSSHLIRTEEGDTLRRNLSEASSDNSTNDYSAAQKLLMQKTSSSSGMTNTNSNTQEMQNQQQQQAQAEQPKENNDNRPSGVVYKYIPPPPINMTARSLLSKQYPNLADISDAATASTSTSTALCGIVKDAEPYLDEWVDYHVGLGFHTIYLIDNSKEHELLNWQNKRRAAGYSIRVMPKPGSHRQMYGYHMCVSEHKSDHTYMAFFDVDEFLVLKKHDTIDEMLQEHLPPGMGSLAISWHIFGTGFTNMYAPLPVTKRFMYRDGVTKHDRHNVWYNVKSIVTLSDYGGYPQSPHSFKTKKGTWIDTTGKGNFDKIGASNYDRPTDVAVIHHYKYLSPKEFYWKTCVRKTVDDKFKDCAQNQNKNSLYTGRVYDDSAWLALKKNVPRYAMFDEFQDFM